MKIIRNNYNQRNYDKEIQSQLLKFECDNCGSELEVNIDEIEIGQLGLGYVTCPCCGENCYDENFISIELNKNVLNFPQHYFSFKDGVNIENDTINKKVKDMITSLENSTDENDFMRFIASGNTIIFVMKYIGDKEYHVVVGKDYYETYVPMEHKVERNRYEDRF